MHNQEEWYLKWLASIKPGDMVYVGDRDHQTIHYWLVTEIEDGYAIVNEEEFDLSTGFGAPGKLFYPTDRVIERHKNMALANKINLMCQPGDLTRLTRNDLLDISDLLQECYDDAGYKPFGLRASHSAAKSRHRTRGSAGHNVE